MNVYSPISFLSWKLFLKEEEIMMKCNTFNHRIHPPQRKERGKSNQIRRWARVGRFFPFMRWWLLWDLGGPSLELDDLDTWNDGYDLRLRIKLEFSKVYVPTMSKNCRSICPPFSSWFSLHFIVKWPCPYHFSVSWTFVLYFPPNFQK